jgi:hypothetical protein
MFTSFTWIALERIPERRITSEPTPDSYPVTYIGPTGDKVTVHFPAPDLTSGPVAHNK